MAVIRITKLNAGRTGNYDDKAVRAYQQTFRVETDNPLDGPLTAERAVSLTFGIVQFRTYYAEPDAVDFGALAESIHAEPEEEEFPYRFIVHVTYSSRIWDEIARRGGTPPASGQGDGGGGSSSQADNPLLAPAEVSYDFQDSVNVTGSDLDGQLIVNSVGDRFSPTLEIHEAIIVITISTNVLNYRPAFFLPYYNAVNSVSFLDFEPHMVLCMGIKGQRAFWNQVRYYKATGVFHVWTRVLKIVESQFQLPARLVGWQIDEAPLDHGAWERKVGATKKSQILRSGVPVADALLNGAGVDAGETGKPIYLLAAGVNTPRFRLRKRMDFNVIYPGIF
jgi:hypothetical protein